MVLLINRVSLTTQSRNEFDLKSDDLPFIIGLSLMGLVIIVLIAALIVVIFVRRANSRVFKYSAVNLETVQATKLNMKPLHGKHDYSDKSLPKVYHRSFDAVDSDNEFMPTRMRFKDRPITRRASVPATLASLEEVPSYLEEGSKRISLSYNCLAEPLDSNSKKSIILPEDKLYMPESCQSSEILSQQICLEKMQETFHRKYSVYDDKSLLGDAYYSRFGKIFFSIQYNADGRLLAVTLIKAQHLMGNRIKGRNKFYVKLRLKKAALHRSISATSLSGFTEKTSRKPDKFNIRGGFRSSIQADFCNPIFEETFKFTNVTSTTLAEYALQFVVKEETPRFLDKNVIIGYVDFVLKNAELIKKHELISDICRDIIPTGPIIDKGQAVLSLHYNREHAILSSSILEILASENDLCGVTVEMYTRSIDNVIVKKKTNLEKNLRSSEVLEFPMENCFLNSVCLVIVIFARVRNCSKTPYGRFIVGPLRFADGPGLTHWAEMSTGNQMFIRSHVIV